MDELFAPGSPLNRDALVSFMTETRVEFKHFTEAIKELTSTMQEAVLRWETETDELRTSLGGLTALRNGHGDLGRRIADAETRLTGLETWRTTEKAWLAAICFFATGLGTLVGHLWPK